MARSLKDNTSLIDLCQKGDHKAYEKLYNLYVKAMLNISYRIVNDKDEAEDIFQETFLKSVKNIKNFENETAYASWLKRVIINSSIDFVRKKKIEFLTIEVAERIEDVENINDDIIYDINTIKACILELPDGYRIIISLYLFEDYQHKDIAAALNISEGTSKSQYNRAKKKLIQLIKQKSISYEQ
jgi:RNA polymerase sigma factor (sigma-70 family)